MLRLFFLVACLSLVSVAMSLSSSSTGSSTIVVGLNGALQKRFVLPKDSRLVPGDVHRASTVQVGVGGKGQDVAIALSCLTYNSQVELAQYVGSGAEGDYVYSLLGKQLGPEALQSLTVRTKSGTRTCTTIVASDTSTELVEPSGVITQAEIKELLEKLDSQESATSMSLCIMGSMPPGCPDDLYADIYKRVQEKSGSSNFLCVIDTVIGLDPLLKAMAEKKCTAMLKLNASELCRLAGVQKTSGEADGVSALELVDSTKGFLKKFPPAREALCGLAITDGKHPAHFVALEDDSSQDDFNIYKIPIANLRDTDSSKVLYPIGAGDTVAAGTLAAWRSCQQLGGSQQANCLDENVQAVLEPQMTDGEASSPEVRQMVSSFAFGLACGSASCLQEENSVFDVEDALRLFRQTLSPVFVSS